AQRFLEIAVRPGASTGAFTTLSPRQPLSSTPYTIRSLNAATADGLSVACVNCVTSSQINSVAGSQISGAIPVASVPAGSSNYIQNTTAQQATSNFNISGNGTAGGTFSSSIVNAATQYNLNGSRVLLVSGGNGGFQNSNTFTGIGAGISNTPSAGSSDGNFNSFFGSQACFSNTIGCCNAFFGYNAGTSNTTGIENAFFGHRAGITNTTGYNNAFFGTFAGNSNSSGANNAFF